MTGATQNYFLPGGTVLKIVLDSMQKAALQGAPMDTVHKKSLHITSDADIVVHYADVFTYSDDGTLIFPSDNQAYGQEFYLNGPNIYHANPVRPNAAGYSIVSRCDSVIIEITPSDSVLNHPPGIPYYVTLNQGEGYFLAGNGILQDLSGSKILVQKSTCCNPINIFVNYAHGAFITWPLLKPGTILPCCSEQLLEQLLPVNLWDTVYPVVRFRNNPYSLFKFVSASNNNKIYFDGIYQFTLNTTQGYDTIINDAIVVTSDNPVSITQNMVSQYHAYHDPQSSSMPVDSASDPSSLLVLPLQQGVREAYFTSLATIPNPNNTNPNPINHADYKFNAITLISKTANVPTIRLNNASVASQFMAFPNNPGYMYAYILLDSITYHLESDEPITAYYYGAYQRGSAAYPIGDIHPNIVKDDSFRICINDTVILTAPAADSVLWSNGSRQQSIKAYETGSYSVQLFYPGGCNKSRTYWVDVTPYTQSQLTDSFYKCPQDTLLLTARPADRYLWDDGSTTATKEAAQYGSYTVVETFQSACSQAVHEFVVSPFAAAPFISLGNDTALCAGDYILLTAPDERTLWSNGSTGSSLTVTQPGVYWAQYTDTCGYSLSDTIVIADTLCMKNFCNLAFPTAFTPNADGRNDVFRAIAYGEFPEYTLEVYDRWGEQVFKTETPSAGWDGTFKGSLAPGDVYFYRCMYKCPLKGNEVQLVKGDLTLIR